jgi:hypothetical protein
MLQSVENFNVQANILGNYVRDLVSRRSRYVPHWVWVFYATVYIEADRLSLSAF